MKNVPERRSVVFYTEDMDVIDFNQVIEADSGDITVSVSGGKQQGYFQYDAPNTPDFLNQLTWYDGPFTYEQFQSIVNNSTWTGQDSALDDTTYLMKNLE